MLHCSIVVLLYVVLFSIAVFFNCCIVLWVYWYVGELLKCYIVVLLYCFIVYIVTLLYCCIIFVVVLSLLSYCCIVVILYCLYCYFVVMLYFLYCCVDALLNFSAVVLLYCCVVNIVYCCIVVLVLFVRHKYCCYVVPLGHVPWLSTIEILAKISNISPGFLLEKDSSIGGVTKKYCWQNTFWQLYVHCTDNIMLKGCHNVKISGFISVCVFCHFMLVLFLVIEQDRVVNSSGSKMVNFQRTEAGLT